MELTALVIAGCTPSIESCDDVPPLPGLSLWFVVLVLAVLAAVLIGAALLVRRIVRGRSAREGASSARVAPTGVNPMS